MNNINFIRGTNDKPVASRVLEETLSKISGLSGECFFGFPLIPMPEGIYSVDATFVSKEKIYYWRGIKDTNLQIDNIYYFNMGLINWIEYERVSYWQIINKSIWNF